MPMTEQEQQRLSEDYSALKVRYWEVVNGINNKGIMLQHEIVKDKLKVAEDTIQCLIKEVKTRNLYIEELKREIREMKKVEPIVEEGVMVIHGTKELGRWVPQIRYLAVLEELKRIKENQQKDV